MSNQQIWTSILLLMFDSQIIKYVCALWFYLNTNIQYISHIMFYFFVYLDIIMENQDIGICL